MSRSLVVLLIYVDSTAPSSDLDSLVEAGAAARGYSIEEAIVSEATADKAFQLVKT